MPPPPAKLHRRRDLFRALLGEERAPEAEGQTNEKVQEPPPAGAPTPETPAPPAPVAQRKGVRPPKIPPVRS